MVLALAIMARIDWRPTLTAFLPVPAVSVAVIYFAARLLIQAASTVSFKPIALVTATSVDRRGLPWADNAR